jgi:hypothetical protein
VFSLFHKCTKKTSDIVGEVKEIKTHVRNFDFDFIPTTEYIDTFKCRTCGKVWERNRKYGD